MASLRKLTLQQEFEIITGVVINNWWALRATETSDDPENFLIQNSGDIPAIQRIKIKALVEMIIQGVISIRDLQCHFSDPIEQVNDFFNSNFNCILQDGSTQEIFTDLMNVYKYLMNNDRESLANLIAKFDDKRELFSEITYDPLKVMRVSKEEQSTEGMPTNSTMLDPSGSDDCIIVDECIVISSDSEDEESEPGMSTKDNISSNMDEESNWKKVSYHNRKKKHL